MGWTQLQPLARRQTTGSIGAPVMIRLDDAGRRDGPRVTLTLRPAQIDLAWLKKDASVSISIGTGEHRGRLLIIPGGPFRLMNTGGKSQKADSALFVRLPLF